MRTVRRTILALLGMLPFAAISQAPGTSEKMRALQSKLTNLALQVANGYRVNLDFSHNSVRQVEEVLSLISNEQKKSNSTEGVFGLALEFGAYIVTVIEKNTESGVWEKDGKAFGENSFPFTWRTSQVFPVNWCLKRIMDGPQDNVWLKYQALVLAKIK